MSLVLWMGIGHYLLSVLVIFALVVALMESSRKFDRFHDNSYLLLAIGYFLLVAWGLIRALAISPSLLQLVAMVFLILGLACLASGYYFHHQAHPYEGEPDSIDASTNNINPKSQKPKVDSSNLTPSKDDWINILSANSAVSSSPIIETSQANKSTTESESIKPEELEKSPIKEQPTPNSPKKVTQKVNKKSEDDLEIDLSYLGRKAKKIVKSERSVVNKTKPITTPTVESKAELMDDLFPLVHKAKKPTSKSSNEIETLPGEGLHEDSSISDLEKKGGDK